LRLNEYMKKTCLLLALAALCGCGNHYRVPIASIDTTLPHTQSAPVSTTADVTADTAAPEPAAVEEPIVPMDSASPVDSRAPRGEAERITAVNGRLEDVFFAYNQFDLSPEAGTTIRRDAEELRGILHDFPQLRITVEGHCDERGSAEYNLALGDRRATSAIGALSQFGLPPVNFAPVSYGKEEPQCVESTEACWSRNRRVHFVVRINATM
jgi:peptidoglycan-associated lipoprotein